MNALRRRRRGHVRADAEVDERVAVLDRVDRHRRLAGRLLFDELHLERLTAAGEEVDRLLAVPHLALEDEILSGHLAHLGLDALEILGHERLRHDEVVEVPLVDGRADAALHARIEGRDGRRHQVGRRVARQRQRFRALVGDDPDARIAGERKSEVDQTLVDHRGQRRLGQSRRDVGGDRAHRSTVGHLAAGAVGERDRNHDVGIRAGRMVGTGRLELPTSCVSSRRSNQLSYAPMCVSPGFAGNGSIAV